MGAIDILISKFGENTIFNKTEELSELEHVLRYLNKTKFEDWKKIQRGAYEGGYKSIFISKEYQVVILEDGHHPAPSNKSCTAYDLIILDEYGTNMDSFSVCRHNDNKDYMKLKKFYEKIKKYKTKKLTLGDI